MFHILFTLIFIKQDKIIIPADFANFMNVSSMVLSTALKAPGISDRATAMPPFLSNSLAPGCDLSMFVKNKSNHTKNLFRNMT